MASKQGDKEYIFLFFRSNTHATEKYGYFRRYHKEKSP